MLLILTLKTHGASYADCYPIRLNMTQHTTDNTMNNTTKLT